MSVCVQALPSSQGAVLSEWTQPRVGSQLSSLQTSPSSQSVFALQQPAMGARWHPRWGSQLSAVHTTWSSQSSASPLAQSPVAGLQLSVPSQTLPLSQLLRTWSQVCVATSQVS